MFIKYCNVITVVLYHQTKLMCFTNVWWLCVSFFLNNITLYCVRAVISVVPDLHKIGKIYTPNGKDKKASLSQHRAKIPQNAKNKIYHWPIEFKCHKMFAPYGIKHQSYDNFFSLFKTIVPAATPSVSVQYHFLIKWIKLQGETISISREQSCKKKIFVCTLLVIKWKFHVLKFILSINWRNYC